ncbi:MAG: hypothetical protein BWY67_02336 [Bacteroidetes bacterium ADurb.Bin397]|nr:MAG: hypothetical protein BWY67_02336 [Bacteroidetes bacterium ADurb.Bin397]
MIKANGMAIAPAVTRNPQAKPSSVPARIYFLWVMAYRLKSVSDNAQV